MVDLVEQNVRILLSTFFSFTPTDLNFEFRCGESLVNFKICRLISNASFCVSTLEHVAFTEGSRRVFGNKCKVF